MALTLALWIWGFIFYSEKKTECEIKDKFVAKCGAAPFLDSELETTNPSIRGQQKRAFIFEMLY